MARAFQYVTSQYNQELLDEMPSWEMIHSLDVSPTSAELAAALERLKCGKAGGNTGVLLELMFYGGPVLHHRLLVLLEVIRTARFVVRDWKDAGIVPIPKKGDLRDCSNCRGISLLDVVYRQVFWMYFTR